MNNKLIYDTYIIDNTKIKNIYIMINYAQYYNEYT